MKPRLLLLALGLCICSAGAATAQTKRIDLGDLQKLVNLSDPQIAPDGKSIACVVSRVNWSDDRFDAHLVSVDIASGTQRTLTYDRKGVAAPRWSPNGDRLAFLATAGSGDKAAPQVFVLDMRGGEARQITEAANGVEQYAWRPGGADIAYVTPDDAENKKEIEAHNDAFEVGDDGYLTTAAPTPSHLWIVPAGGGTARRLTHGAWSLAKSEPPGPPSSPLAWSPDGKSILFTQQATPHFGDADQSVVMVLDVVASESRKLTAHKALEGYATYSPDGSRISYWYPRDGDPNNENEIYVTPASGGDGTDQTRAVDRSLVRAVWMPDGKSLLLGGHDGTSTALWLLPLGGTAKRLDLGDVSPSWGFWIDVSVGSDGAVAFAGSTPDRPTELYYLASPTAPPRRLTDLNAEVASRQLGTMERLEWPGPDGFRDDGVVTYPPGYVKGKRYPLVLIIRGRARLHRVLTQLPRLGQPRQRLPARHLQRRGRRTGAGRHGRDRGARAARRGGHHARRRVGMVVRRLHDHMAHGALPPVESSRRRGRGDEPRGPVQHGRLQRAGALQLLELRLPLDGEGAPGVPGPVSHLLRRGDEDTHADPVGRTRRASHGDPVL